MDSEVLDLKANLASIESFDTKHQLHYLSVHFMDNGEFGKARLMREVTEAFLDSKIKVEGFAEFNANCPAVSEEELSKVPGAKVALGSVDALKLEVLVRDGASVIIKPDEAKYFRSIPDRYCEEFEKLFKEHGEKYAQCFLAQHLLVIQAQMPVDSNFIKHILCRLGFNHPARDWDFQRSRSWCRKRDRHSWSRCSCCNTIH